MDALSLQGTTLALEAARAAGLVMVSPLLWAEAPMRVRATIALLLALISHGAGTLTGATFESFTQAAAMLPVELLVGAAMGFVVRISVGVVEMAGDIISPGLGLGAAALFDPHTQATESPLTRMLRYVALLLALIAGVHRAIIAALLASFRMFPPGTRIDPSHATTSLVQMSSAALMSGVRIALPVVAVLLVTQIALAFISRAAPQMQIFSIGFAVSLVAGSITLLIALPDLASEILGDFSQVGHRIELIATAMTSE